MSWMVFLPELYLLAMGGVFLAFTLVRPDASRDRRTAVALAAAGVGVALACVGMEGDLFHGAYRVDLFTQVFKVILFTGLLLITAICSPLDIDPSRHSEFFTLLAVSTLAMVLMVGSVHLLTLWVALELSSYSLYILVFLRRDGDVAVSAGLKYFLTGAAASAMTLFGMALLYGATRALYVVDLMRVLPGVIGQPAVVIGLVMTLSGFLFKLAVFPFHSWAPDVYEGAAHQVAAVIATASKVAAVAVLVRLAAATGGGSRYLVDVLAVLSIASMTVGNLAAIVQKDIKRLLAYSSVAQAGYVLIGVLSMNAAGYTGALFYALALLLMKFTCFMVVSRTAPDGRNMELSQLAGLHRRSPAMALALMMALFGLAGIPPTVGFTGKLLIFTAAVQAGHLTLVFIAMGNVVVSLYYYLLVVKAAYLDEPEAGNAPPPPVDTADGILAIGLVAAMVAAGFFPGRLIEIFGAAARILM